MQGRKASFREGTGMMPFMVAIHSHFFYCSYFAIKLLIYEIIIIEK